MPVFKGYLERLKQLVRERYFFPMIRRRQRIESFRAVETQEFGVIVGNGPSLRIADLERVSHLPSFGCNHIALIFQHSTWRPTYYVLADPKVAARVNFDWLMGGHTTVVATSTCAPFLPSKLNAIVVRERFTNARFASLAPNLAANDRFAFSTDLADGIEAGWTTSFTSLQLAF